MTTCYRCYTGFKIKLTKKKKYEEHTTHSRLMVKTDRYFYACNLVELKRRGVRSTCIWYEESPS